MTEVAHCNVTTNEHQRDRDSCARFINLSECCKRSSSAFVHGAIMRALGRTVARAGCVARRVPSQNLSRGESFIRKKMASHLVGPKRRQRRFAVKACSHAAAILDLIAALRRGTVTPMGVDASRARRVAWEKPNNNTEGISIEPQGV